MTKLGFSSKVTFTTLLNKEIVRVLANYRPEKIFTLVDENTKKLCLPKILPLADTKVIETKSGESNKTIESVVEIWKYLNSHKADRKSIIVNIGGGLLCDVGGFAASTFKRGIDFINIPTTLLAQVDASIGGKTGINFMHFKNEIGVINSPKDVLISPVFFETLDDRNILSGFAEMLKHALLDSKKHLNDIGKIDFKNSSPDIILSAIEKSVKIKQTIVLQDPFEKGIRKALNLGHTIGHAFETFAQKNKIHLLHGEAVALGLIPELMLSVKKCNFKEENYRFIVKIIQSKYHGFKFTEKDIDTLIEIMRHDKKNEGNDILFTLLEDFAQPIINQKISEDEIKSVLQKFMTIY